MTSDYFEVSVAEEIGRVWIGKPHVVLLGAGASKAALPTGDRHGRSVPLLREVAQELDLDRLFPPNLSDIARNDFEGAYSQLFERGEETVKEIDNRVADYFGKLDLPEEPNLYDVLILSLRNKDAIFTFNWDPFLMQSRTRLARLGVPSLPKMFFLHGNVTIGFCDNDRVSGVNGKQCSKCGEHGRWVHPT